MADYIEDSSIKLDWAMPFQRTGKFPLDRSSMFYSYADAVKYAKGDTSDPDERGLCGSSYIGQQICVYENDTVTYYKIDADRTLSSIDDSDHFLLVTLTGSPYSNSTKANYDYDTIYNYALNYDTVILKQKAYGDFKGWSEYYYLNNIGSNGVMYFSSLDYNFYQNEETYYNDINILASFITLSKDPETQKAVWRIKTSRISPTIFIRNIHFDENQNIKAASSGATYNDIIFSMGTYGIENKIPVLYDQTNDRYFYYVHGPNTDYNSDNETLIFSSIQEANNSHIIATITVDKDNTWSYKETKLDNIISIDAANASGIFFLTQEQCKTIYENYTKGVVYVTAWGITFIITTQLQYDYNNKVSILTGHSLYNYTSAYDKDDVFKNKCIAQMFIKIPVYHDKTNNNEHILITYETLEPLNESSIASILADDLDIINALTDSYDNILCDENQNIFIIE